MKNIKVLLTRVFFPAVVAVLHLPSFSAYNQEVSFDGAGEEGGISVSKVVLSYKGEPVCVSSLAEDSSLTPDFLNPVPSLSYDGESPLPDCNTEEKDIIHQSARDALPMNEKGGVDVAGAPVALFICGVGVVGGVATKIMGESSASEKEEIANKLVAPSLTALGGAQIAITGGNSSAAVAVGGAGAISEASVFALKSLSYLKSFLGTGAIMASCGAGAYYGLSYILD